MNHQIVILMTSTVTPRAYRTQTALHDPVQRLAQYKEAISFWLNYHDARISGVVFCDNSGADEVLFSHFHTESVRHFEFLSFVDDLKPEGVHYGYSELGIIDYAIKNSDLIRKSDFVLKTTGRFVFPQASRLFDDIASQAEFAIDCYTVRSNNIDYPFRCRTQIFFFSKEFYARFFLGRRDEMIGLCSHIEEYIPRHLERLKRPVGEITYRWKHECNPIGVGANSNNYQSIKNRFKYKLRGFLRVLIPQLWI